ncbi:MAG: ATP-binding protein [Polyangiales bacterium]
MVLDVLAESRWPVRREEDIVTVRKRARTIAEARGFDAFATAALTTACSELARNVWVHAGGGEVCMQELTDGYRSGIRIAVSDSGPGIDDVARVLAGGYSTAGSLGLGISGTMRLVDFFVLESHVGRGPIVTITKWKRL